VKENMHSGRRAASVSSLKIILHIKAVYEEGELDKPLSRIVSPLIPDYVPDSRASRT
jgi:hypothetical protein